LGAGLKIPNDMRLDFDKLPNGIGGLVLDQLSNQPSIEVDISNPKSIDVGFLVIDNTRFKVPRLGHSADVSTHFFALGERGRVGGIVLGRLYLQGLTVVLRKEKQEEGKFNTAEFRSAFSSLPIGIDLEGKPIAMIAGWAGTIKTTATHKPEDGEANGVVFSVAAPQEIAVIDHLSLGMGDTLLLRSEHPLRILLLDLQEGSKVALEVTANSQNFSEPSSLNVPLFQGGVTRKKIDFSEISISEEACQDHAVYVPLVKYSEKMDLSSIEGIDQVKLVANDQTSKMVRATIRLVDIDDVLYAVIHVKK
jgi:hypothetical protein